MIFTILRIFYSILALILHISYGNYNELCRSCISAVLSKPGRTRFALSLQKIFFQ